MIEIQKNIQIIEADSVVSQILESSEMEFKVIAMNSFERIAVKMKTVTRELIYTKICIEGKGPIYTIGIQK